MAGVVLQMPGQSSPLAKFCKDALYRCEMIAINTQDYMKLRLTYSQSSAESRAPLNARIEVMPLNAYGLERANLISKVFPKRCTRWLVEANQPKAFHSAPESLGRVQGD